VRQDDKHVGMRVKFVRELVDGVLRSGNVLEVAVGGDVEEWFGAFSEVEFRLCGEMGGRDGVARRRKDGAWAREAFVQEGSWAQNAGMVAGVGAEKDEARWGDAGERAEVSRLVLEVLLENKACWEKDSYTGNVEQVEAAVAKVVTGTESANVECRFVQVKANEFVVATRVRVS
jgi:hypothetical protein